jgi:hypothetical protein
MHEGWLLWELERDSVDRTPKAVEHNSEQGNEDACYQVTAMGQSGANGNRFWAAEWERNWESFTTNPSNSKADAFFE